MEKQDRRQALFWWGVCFLLVMLFFGTDMFLEYNADSYGNYANLAGTARATLFADGRPIIAAFLWLWGVLGLSSGTAYTISYTAGVLLLSASVYLVQRFICRQLTDTVRSRVAALAAAFLLIVNPFSIEYFLYMITDFFILALFLAVCAFLLLQQYLDTHSRKYLYLCLVLLLVSVFTYQAGAGLFVVLNLMMILRRSKTPKDFITNNLLVMGAYGLPAVIAWFTTVKLIHSDRFQESAGLFERIRIAAAGIQALFNILPCKVCHICVFGVFCLLAVRIVGQGKQVPWRLFGLVYLCAGTAVAGMAPAVAMAATSYRSTYPVASILGVLVWYWLQLAQEQDAPAPKWQRGGVTVLAALLLAVQYGKFQSIIITRYTTNRVDRFMIEAIGQRIAEYERDHESVSKVSIYYDAGLTELYDPVEGWIGDFNARSFARSWSIFPSLELYTGRAFARGEQDPALAEHFAQQDWDAFSQEQMVFDGDTLHLCIF